MSCPCCGSTLGFWGSLASIAGLIASVCAAFAAGRAVAAARSVRRAFSLYTVANRDLAGLVEVLAAARREAADGNTDIALFLEEAIAGTYLLREHPHLSHDHRRHLGFAYSRLKELRQDLSPGGRRVLNVAHELDVCYNTVAARVQTPLLAGMQDEP